MWTLRRTVLILAAAVLAGAAGGLLRVRAHRPPRVELAETSWDFGQVLPGAELRHTFRIQNTGGQVLQVLDVRAGCACLSAEVTDSAIAPGEEAALVISFGAPRLRTDGAYEVFIRSNDLERPVVSLSIAFSVKPPFEVAPDPIDFGLVRRSSLPARRVLVVRRGEPADQGPPPDLVVDDPHVRVASCERTPAGTFRVVLELTEAAPAGPVNCHVDVRFAEWPGMVRRIHIVGKLLDSVRAVPDALMLSLPEPGRSEAKATIVGAGSQELMKVAASSAIADYVSVDCRQSPEGPVVIVALRPGIARTRRRKVLSGNVTVIVGGPEPRALTIPVVVVTGPGSDSQVDRTPSATVAPVRPESVSE